ncbi:hypothetical protein [Leifsonia poae]|uniref:hypothetical protein n=1 Tax=Leifsonia poae TaxID=110933 RepID=UPI003D67CCA8
MMWLTDVRAGAWIAPRLSGWGRVGGVVPRGFEAYARILHPVEATRVEIFDAAGDELEYPSVIDTATWPWAEVARRTGRTMHPLVQWSGLVGSESHVTLDDGWRAQQPRTGFLDPELLASLSETLTRHTSAPDEVVFGVWVGWGEINGSRHILYIAESENGPADVEAAIAELQAESSASVSPLVTAVIDAEQAAQREGVQLHSVLELPGREYVLASITVGELTDPTWPRRAGMGWSDGFEGPMPQLIWPADHAWFVASEIDFDSTIVGGSRALIDAVLAIDALETFEVSADDDLSSLGDTINAAPSA